MPEFQNYEFHSPGIFAGQTGVIDSADCIIRGVSIITGGITAEGHNLEVDDTTLKQLQTCAKAKGKIPVTLDHGSGVKDLNGYITGFRMDGDKLRGDWHLLKSHDETDKMLERAEVMPECFGLSVAFKGPKAGVAIGNGKYAARCEKLLSVDVVTRPAANDGLFSAKSVDNQDNDNMPKQNAAQATPPVTEGEPSLKDVLTAIQTVNERLDEHEQFLGQLGGQEPTLEDLEQMEDAELEALGITRAEVDAAVTEAKAAMAAEAGDDEAAEAAAANATATTIDASAPGATAAAAAPAGATASAFNALQKQVIELQKKLAARDTKEAQEAEEHQFAEIETKMVTLAKQRDDFQKENVELKAKVDALELCVRTGTRPVTAGVDNGMRMFSADGDGKLHEFQARVKQVMAEGKNAKTEGEAIIFCQKENPALHQDWVNSLRRKNDSD